MQKRCEKCKSEKSVAEFNFKNKSRGTYQSFCRACQKRYKDSHYRNNQKKYVEAAGERKKRNLQFLNDLKERQACMDCERFYPAVVMDFDHVKGSKRGDLSVLARQGVSLAVLKEECEKCEIVCSNCRRLRTSRRLKQ